MNLEDSMEEPDQDNTVFANCEINVKCPVLESKKFVQIIPSISIASIQVKQSNTFVCKKCNALYDFMYQ